MNWFWLAPYNLMYAVAPSRLPMKNKSGHSVFRFSKIFTVSSLFILFLLAGVIANAQPTPSEKEMAYKKTVTERVTKIVNTLEISDSQLYHSVLNDIVNQYFQLNMIHEAAKAGKESIKVLALGKEESDKALKENEDKKNASLLQQHASFINLLNGKLSAEQLEKVKDGMTYRVFPITYSAYLDMLPNLTTEQKDKLYNWLKEARELAMDAGSADEKHAVFGKYKGRINNYLSAAGYDMKKEGEEWQKRIKEREEKKKQDQ